MICSRRDLAYYLEEDRKAFGKSHIRTLRAWVVNRLFPDRNFSYVYALRHLEYWTNCGGGGGVR